MLFLAFTIFITILLIMLIIKPEAIDGSRPDLVLLIMMIITSTFWSIYFTFLL